MKSVYKWAGAFVLAFCLVAPLYAGGGRQAASGLKVAIVTTGGVDDPFGQGCYNGILEFIKANPEATVTAFDEPDMAKVVQLVANIITRYDVLVLAGFQFAQTGPIFQDNPGHKAILVDTTPVDAAGNTIELKNVYSMQFCEEESGFFAGITAALETKTGKLAVVNGIAIPSNVNYQFGFMSGVNYANKHYGSNAVYIELPAYAGIDVNGRPVGGNYIGGFADAVTGKVLGEALIAQGVDVLFAAAGGSGTGVFTAAKEASEVYLIGVDTDQYDDGMKGDRNIILTSVLKVMHTNVAKQLQAVKDGTFYGKNYLLGASTDSTGFVSAQGRHNLSANTLNKLQDAYKELKAGSIVPASNFNGHTPTSFPGMWW
jgi:basic membrane protein A